VNKITVSKYEFLTYITKMKWRIRKMWIEEWWPERGRNRFEADKIHESDSNLFV